MTFQPPPPPPGQPPYGEQPPYGGQPGYGAQPQQPPVPPQPPQYAPPPAPPQPQYAPPPPPQSQPQYAPPPQQYAPQGSQQYAPQGYGAPAAGGPGFSMASFDPKSVNPMDWGILGIGFLALIFSFFDYYTVSVSFGAGSSASASASAWHGFFGWFAALLALASAALIAIELFAPQVTLPVPIRLASLGGFAVATLCVILALFIFPGGTYDGPGVDYGHGFSYWLSLILIIAGLVLSVLRLKATGGKLPWEKGPGSGSSTGAGPTGFGGPGGTIPPHGYNQPQGYNPPPPAGPQGYNPPPPNYGPPQ